MKKRFVFAAAVGLAVLAVFLAAPRFLSTRAADPAAAAEKSKKYFCPMHPDYTSHRPGDCPICHMRLVPAETADAPPALPATDPRALCLLHNCPMEKNGEPCPMLVVAAKGEKVTCPLCRHEVSGSETAPSAGPQISGPPKVAFYRHPMNPSVSSPVPAKDEMGMDYIPVYEHELGSPAVSGTPKGYAAVLVSPEKQQLIGLRKSAAARKRFVKTIRASARVAHDAELYQTQSEYLESLRSLERSGGAQWAESLVEASRTKLVRMGLSGELISELEEAGQADRSLLYAEPSSGAWIYAGIYEYELPYVKIGDTLTVEVPSRPGERIAGPVRAIDPTVDPMTRTVRVRARVPNTESLLKPDMYVTALLSSDLGERIVVPKEAVFFTGSEAVVFVDKGEGLLEPRRLVIGARGEDEFEVLSGLEEGENVVTNGNFLIDSESRLKAALGVSTDGPAPAADSPPSGHEGHSR